MKEMRGDQGGRRGEGADHLEKFSKRTITQQDAANRGERYRYLREGRCHPTVAIGHQGDQRLGTTPSMRLSFCKAKRF
jgi:hypothetical protein